MYGAILGDIIGSPYEFDKSPKTKDFPLLIPRSRYTDDSMMTVAVAEALLDTLGKERVNLRNAVIHSMQKWGRRYPDCYWWVPGTLNKDNDTNNPDLLSMVDYMFWNTGLELLFQEVVPTFDAFEHHVFTREQWYAIREIAKEKGGVWGRCLLETDAWADRAFKRYNEFTLRTV